MSNYVLKINLEGADKSASQIDSLISKVGALGGAGVSKLSNFKIGILDIGKAFEKAGVSAEKMAKQSSKAIAEQMAHSLAMYPEASGDFGNTKGMKFYGNIAETTAEAKANRDAIAEAQRQHREDAMDAANWKAYKYGPTLATLSNAYSGNKPPILPKESVVLGTSGGLAQFAKFAGELGLAIVAIDLFKNAVKSVAKEIKKAFEFASQLYSKALNNGLSLQLQTQRTMTADVLGVPEEQVNRFKQSRFVMQQLADAIGEISKDAPKLAFVNSEFKILGYDILALASNIATKLSPALIGLMNILDVVVKSITKNIGNLTAGLEGLLSETFTGKIALLLGAKLYAMGTQTQAQAGFNNPLAMMKQLPASTWERMGLLVGGGANNYARDTAKNTRDTVMILKTLLKPGSARAGGSNRAGPDWGYSPNTAQP